MIDVHSHILQEIDDGCASIDRSIVLIKDELLNGVDKIFLTPHYNNGKEFNTIDKISEKYQKLLEKLKEENINVSLYLGQEYFVDDDFYKLLKEGNLVTLNKTKYVLVEFPYFDETDILDHIYKIISFGYIPIIAHIERYAYLDWNLLIELKMAGALMQVNASCIIGEYGRKMKKLALSAIKDGLVNFIASDIHDSRRNYMRKAYDKVAKKLGVDFAEKVFNKNAQNLI
jgi:protein-tyrosine phosphatase